MKTKYLNLYLKFLKKFIDLKRPIKVVFDCFNGSTGPIAFQLFKTVPFLKAHFINFKSNGYFPAHGPNPLIKGKLAQLKKEVIKRKADLGVAFDADGDRAFFVDNSGKILPSYVMVKLLRLNQKSKMVTDLITYSCLNLVGLLDKNTFQSRVGSYFIKKAMRSHQADFGIEDSGHYYFKEFFYADSGILAAIKVINQLSRLPYSLKDFYDFLPFLIIKKKIIKTKKPKTILKEFSKKYAKKALAVSQLDGLSFYFKNSWLNVRPSNTESLIRITEVFKQNKKTEKS